MVFPGHTRLLFDVSAVDSVKQKFSGKECDKACHESVIMPCLFLTVLLGGVWQFLVVLTYFLN